MIESFIRELENEIQQLFPMGEACSNQKTYLEEVDGSAQNPRGKHLSRPGGPFWGRLAAILDFAGSAALQVVSKSPRRR